MNSSETANWIKANQVPESVADVVSDVTAHGIMLRLECLCNKHCVSRENETKVAEFLRLAAELFH